MKEARVNSRSTYYVPRLKITTEKTRMVVTVRMVSVEVKLVELSVSCGMGGISVS